MDKELTLKMMSQDAGVADWNKMAVLQEMEKLTGIKLEYQNLRRSTASNQEKPRLRERRFAGYLLRADLKPAEQVNLRHARRA